MKLNPLSIGIATVCALLLMGFLLLTGLTAIVVGASDAGQTSGCSVAPASPSGAGMSTVSSADVTATASSSPSGSCYAASPYAAQVVGWAKRMADALYVNPACGKTRGGKCNDTYYTSAFPSQVIAYGQNWCKAHGDCYDWANGTYQCVSFVRGAYSQVYPMNYTNDAFALWATYQHLPGWQEIPSAAVADPAQRFLPEPGDVMIFRDTGVGHVAIVIAVQAPQGQKNGWVQFANANSSSAYDRMPLLPNLTVDTSEWAPSRANYLVWGYLRPKLSASRNLVRISQIDQSQYANQGEWGLWAYSACSTASMTEVLNAYGMHVRIHDVLAVEKSLIVPGSSPPLPYITPSLGLTNDAGIEATMQHFGFHTTWGEHWTLAQVVGTANGGEPVIVSWPPSRYADGHIVVVTGGDLAVGTITIADSSTWNRHILSVNQFMQWWNGFAAVSTPAK
jgi:hypothetical protein